MTASRTTGSTAGGKLENPARHRDGDPVVGQLADEREHHFPGRFAWDRYAAARRRTSFSCSSSRIRRLPPQLIVLRGGRARLDAVLDISGLSQFSRHDSEIPKSAAIVLEQHAGLAAAGHPDHVLAELTGIGLGHGEHPSSGTSRHHRSDVTPTCSSPLRVQRSLQASQRLLRGLRQPLPLNYAGGAHSDFAASPYLGRGPSRLEAPDSKRSCDGRWDR